MMGAAITKYGSGYEMCIRDSCKADPRVIKVVEVAFQVLVGEVARYAGEVVHHPLPVDVSRFGQFQQGGNFRIDFEKGDVRKGQRAVGHHALELHKMCIRDRYYSVNYDTRTVAAMVAAFGTEAVAEGYYREPVSYTHLDVYKRQS